MFKLNIITLLHIDLQAASFDWSLTIPFTTNVIPPSTTRNDIVIASYLLLTSRI